MYRCRMISAFGSGAAFSFVSGMASGNKLQGAFTTGTLFALFQGVFYVVGSTMCTGPCFWLQYTLPALEIVR